MNEQKNQRHYAAREAFQESLERLQQVLDLSEAQVQTSAPHERLREPVSDLEPPIAPQNSDLDMWEDAVNDIDRFLQSDRADSSSSN
ncbi:MAG: hypothetical protein SWY16_13485 [Cyanobacteriota bacterium]|nr:hypothetical protein [Cyanobacteriota bacterium]